MLVNSPMAHAALRRTTGLELYSSLDKEANAGRPKDASASAACSPGEACLKVSSAGLQRLVSQQRMSCVLVSSPSIALSDGIAPVSRRFAASHADTARSSGGVRLV